MFNLDEELESYKNNCARVQIQEYVDFHEMEVDFLNTINQCTRIRMYLKENPDLCNEETLAFMSNKPFDREKIDDKYKCLVDVLTITAILTYRYQEEANKLVDNKQYQEAINLQEQIYKFSPAPQRKVQIANLYVDQMQETDKADELYKSVEAPLQNDPYYWLCRSMVLYNRKDFYGQIEMIQKGLKLRKIIEDNK